MPELKRDLGLLPMTALAVSMMLGSGIFFGPSLTASEFPDTRVVLALWALGGVIAFLGAWVFGRLAARLPLSGGPYAYLRASFGPYTAFLFSWTSFVIIAPTSMAVLATLLARSVGVLVPMGDITVKLVATAAVVVFALVNVASVRMGGAAQSALSILKVALVLGLVTILALLAGTPAATSPGISAGGRWSLAFVGILFSYGGWDYAVLAGEEIRDAKRNIPRGLLLGVAIVTVLYMASVWGYLAALGPAGVAGASASLAPTAVGRVLPAAEAVVAVAVAISSAGTINAVMLLGPRATYALARDGLVPAWLGRVSERGVPTAAILLQAATTLAYVWTGAFAVVAAYTVLGTGVFIMLSSIGLILLSRAEGERSLTLTLAALAVAGVFGWFIVFLVIEAPQIAAWGLGLIMAGSIPYALLAWRQAKRRQAETDAAASQA